MTASVQKQFDKVFAQLTDDGLLLLSDAKLPSVSGLIANEKLRGSWWSHKSAQTIFNVSEMLEDHPDVMIMKLISGKVTFVHRALWNQIYSIGVAREDWQVNKLSNNACILLGALDHEGMIQTNNIGKTLGPKPGETARELESRLLIHSEQIHTESGAHAKVLETWPAWAKRAGFRARAKDPLAARRFLEERLSEINNKHNGNGSLPWPATV
jgi:hypothetical protein